MYSIRILKPATKELEKLNVRTAERITERIRWLSENIRSAKLFPLKGELAGLYKIREGSYRVIFEIIHDERLIIIHSIGHRRDIYKKR